MTPTQAARLIEQSATPAALFGAGLLGGAPAEQAYRKLAALVHPDRHHGDPRMTAAFARLSELRDQHAAAAAGPDLVARGDIADLFRVPGSAAVLKIPRDPADNDLMGREVTALRALRTAAGDSRYLPFIPALDTAARQRDPATGAVRLAVTLGWLDGFVSLADVAAAYPAGIAPEDAAWMWRRLLTVLGFAHGAGIIHGAVLPPHVMIHPDMHGLVLVDWCYSAAPGGRIPAIVDAYRDLYPPEVAAKETPGEYTDIAMAAATMGALMGARAPWQLSSFAAGCQLARPGRRPAAAWPLLGELDDLLDRLYGPRTFHPFTMPVRA